MKILEGIPHKIKLIGVHGGASYPFLVDSDGNNDPGVFIVAETVMGVVATEKLQEFVKSADISPEDADVEYILSVDDDEFCIMNTTSDVKDEWKPMDLTKIDEWVNAGFVIEGVTEDKYTDLLKMYCEMESQNVEDKFNAADYLKDHMDVLPKASVEACKTKEDCDALLNRLGLK